MTVAKKFFDGGRLLAQPEPDLFGIGAKDDVGKALDVLALRCAANEAVAARRPEVPPFSTRATAIRMFFLIHSFIDHARLRWSKFPAIPDRASFALYVEHVGLGSSFQCSSEEGRTPPCSLLAAA